MDCRLEKKRKLENNMYKHRYYILMMMKSSRLFHLQNTIEGFIAIIGFLLLLSYTLLILEKGLWGLSFGKK